MNERCTGFAQSNGAGAPRRLSDGLKATEFVTISDATIGLSVVRGRAVGFGPVGWSDRPFLREFRRELGDG